MLFEYLLLATVMLVAICFIFSEVFYRHALWASLANTFAAIACSMLCYQFVVDTAPQHTWWAWAILSLIGAIFTARKAIIKFGL